MALVCWLPCGCETTVVGIGSCPVVGSETGLGARAGWRELPGFSCNDTAALYPLESGTVAAVNVCWRFENPGIPRGFLKTRRWAYPLHSRFDLTQFLHTGFSSPHLMRRCRQALTISQRHYHLRGPN